MSPQEPEYLGTWAPFMASCACSELAHSLVNIISVIGRAVKGFLWVFHKIIEYGTYRRRANRLGLKRSLSHIRTLLLARIVDGQAGAGGAPACPAESARRLWTWSRREASVKEAAALLPGIDPTKFRLRLTFLWESSGIRRKRQATSREPPAETTSLLKP